MAGFLERIGATTTPRQLLLVVFLLAGQFLLLAFALPEQLGSALSARVLIFVAVTFVGAGLIYLSVLPEGHGSAG